MSSQFVAQKGRLTIGGVVCNPDGTIKSTFDLKADVPEQSRRRFTPLPCALQHNNVARNIIADALVDLFDLGSANATGKLRIYTTGGITLLSTILMAAPPAFGDAATGVADANTLPWTDLTAVGAGTASEFTALDRDENIILTGDVALSGQEMTFPQLEIALNDIVKLLSVSYTAPP